MLFVFDLSLESQQGFDAVVNMFQTGFFARLIAWGLVSSLIYHLFAGTKHLLMDCGYLEEIESANLAAKVVMGAGVAGVILSGVWIW